MLLAIVGAGYVGLVTAACLAHLGNEVRVLERDRARVDGLRRGQLPIREPGLDELVAEGMASGRLTFDSDPASIRGTRLTIVCVGTLDEDGEWTDRVVRRAVLGIAADLEAPRAIVIRSTLLPGTAAGLAAEICAVDPTVELAFNPEFTREATAVNDFLMPDRVVIGVTDPSLADGTLLSDLRRLYAPLKSPVVVTDLTSAEAIKVASNVFLAAKITFANELARLCAALGADVGAVVDGMGLDKRIGRNFLSPGPGFGGSCFPSQARALPQIARRLGVRVAVMDAVWQSNEDQSDWLLDRLEEAAGQDVAGLRVALLGLTFKGGTDDLRESPALRLAHRLVGRGAAVTAFDPASTASGVAQLRAEGVAVANAASAADACDGADAVVVATDWPEFRLVDWGIVAPRMRGRNRARCPARGGRGGGRASRTPGRRHGCRGAACRRARDRVTDQSGEERAMDRDGRPAGIGEDALPEPGSTDAVRAARCVLDLHTHSSSSFNSRIDPRELVRLALRAGLTHLAITDHEKIEGALRARDRAAPGLVVIVGEEIRSTAGDVIALYVDTEIPGGMSFVETVAAIRSQGGIVGLPHGFDAYRPSVGVGRDRPDDLLILAHSVDYVEIHNGRVSTTRANERAAEFAQAHGLPGVAASDAHRPADVGRCAVVLRGPIESAEDLRAALAGERSLIVREPAADGEEGQRPRTSLPGLVGRFRHRG